MRFAPSFPVVMPTIASQESENRELRRVISPCGSTHRRWRAFLRANRLRSPGPGSTQNYSDSPPLGMRRRVAVGGPATRVASPGWIGAPRNGGRSESGNLRCLVIRPRFPCGSRPSKPSSSRVEKRPTRADGHHAARGEPCISPRLRWADRDAMRHPTRPLGVSGRTAASNCRRSAAAVRIPPRRPSWHG